MDANAVYSASNWAIAVAYIGAAAFVLWGRRSRVNILLSVALVTYGAVCVGSGLIYMMVATGGSEWIRANASLYSIVFATTCWFPYLAFLGAAVASPLVRPLRPIPVALALTLLPGIALLAVLVRPDFAAYADAGGQLVDGPLVVFYRKVVSPWLAGGVALLATTAALDAYRRAPAGTLLKRRARAYATAFIAHDLSILSWMSAGFIADVDTSVFFSDILANVFGLIFIFFLLRALLRDQLFDFDVKLKLGVKRTTVAGAFIAVFFVASQLIEQFTTGTFGLLGGAIVAGLLLFAMHPLQRAAERVADATVPGAVATPAYLAFRKVEVYRAQVESSRADDGRIDERERAFLDRLRANLGLTTDDAAAVERDVAGANPS